MNINRTVRLAATEYFPQPFIKDLIVLHHTVGRSARSTFESWRSDGKRIATAYTVERDGMIYEVFPPDCWAYHIGVKGRRELERRSIGIEIASEGPLICGDGKYYAFGRIYGGEVYDHGREWRGYRHFAAYTPAAMETVYELVEDLISRFDLPRQMASAPDWRGVAAHCDLRPDKTDVHPGFDWKRLIERCRLRTSIQAAAWGRDSSTARSHSLSLRSE